MTKVKECRHLTFWGWLLITGCIAILIFLWFVTIHDFLAFNKPLNTKIWVIEGYVPDFVLENVAVAAKKTPDLILICTGLSIEKPNFYGGYNNYADYNAAVLRLIGVDSLRVISAPAPYTNKERTYKTALSAKEKLKKLGYISGNVNVVCLGTHARRSQLLYRKAFGKGWKIGAISYHNNTYIAESWWRTSEGVRNVVYEMFAYLYCLLFFHP